MDKLQRAGRDFLMRLVAQHGLDGAARVLRALAMNWTAFAGSPSASRTRAAELVRRDVQGVGSNPVLAGPT